MQQQKLFSKSGNSISDRFQILKQSHEILTGTRPKCIVKALQLPEFKISLPKERGPIQVAETVRRRSERKRRTPSSFSKAQSRDEFYKSKASSN